MKRIAALSFFLLAAVACAPPSEPAAEEHAGATINKEIVPGVTAHQWFHPGGAYFQGLAYVAFVGTDRKPYVVRKRGDGGWDGPFGIDDTSLQGVSIIANGGSLMLAYYNGFGQLVIWKSFDGANFIHQRTYDIGANSVKRLYGEPALVLLDGTVHAFMAYGPTNPTPQEWVAQGEIRQVVEGADGHWFWGTSWPARTATPSAAMLGNDTLVIAYPHYAHGAWYVRRWTRQHGWEEPREKFESRQGMVFASADDDGTPTVTWIHRDVRPTDPHRIRTSKSRDGFFYDFVKNTDQFSDRRPMGIAGSGQSNVLEFAHIGSDGSVNFTRTTYR